MASLPKFRTVLLGAVLLVGIAFGVGLSRCGPGLGTGAGLPAASPRSEDPPQPEAPPEHEDDTATERVVMVTGSRCRLDRDSTLRECADLCLELKALRSVWIDTTEGAHETVDALQHCLEAAGVSVSLRSQ